MNKSIVLGIVILVIGVSFTGSTNSLSMRKSQMLSFEGKTLYVGGSGEGNYSMIQDAIDNASDGDTVFVYDDSSPYDEPDIIIGKSINLIGENRDTTVILNNMIEIEKVVDGVNISGFTLNSGQIFAKFSSNIIIFNNRFLDCSFAIQLDAIDDCFVSSNLFYNCWSAILNLAGKNMTFSNNFIYSLGVHAEVYGDISCWDGRNIVVTNNTLICYGVEYWSNGIRLESTSDIIIEGNEFNDYSLAIYSYLLNKNVKVTHNNIIENSIGIHTGSISHSFKITNNNFINNSGDVEFGFLSYNNLFDGNYWDKWIGLRYPLPIFQKFPKVIFGYKSFLYRTFFPWFAIDWHPAKEPYNIISNPYKTQ